MRNLIFLASIAVTLLLANNTYAQFQKGQDLMGEFAKDSAGWSISMPDANTIAIASPCYGADPWSPGKVRVYSWNSNSWTQKGGDLYAEMIPSDTMHHFGTEIIMPDSNTIAIKFCFEGCCSYLTRVRVYYWNGIEWLQKGDEFLTSYGYYGTQSFKSFDMPNENTISLSIGFNTKVYIWDGFNWTQKGVDLISGRISMPDENTIGILGLGSSESHIFYWNGLSWVEKGSGFQIDNLLAAYSGISMANENTLALIKLNYIPSQVLSYTIGVEVFSWNGSEWVLKGNEVVTGLSNGNYHSNYIEMADVDNFAISNYFYNDYNLMFSPDSMDFKIYKWNGVNWSESLNTTSIDVGFYSMSFAESNTYAIGSSGNNFNGNGAGLVQVFSFCNYSTLGILGNVAPNSYSTEVYSCDALPGSSYNWEVNNGVILSGQGTSNVSVLWGPEGIGSINVVETTLQGCVGELIQLQIDVQCLTTSNSIFGPLGPLAFSNQTYTCNGPISSDYNWSVMNGVILSGQGTNSIEVLWGTQGMGSITLYETSSDGCVGDSIIQNIVVIPTSVEEFNLGSIYYYENAIHFSEISAALGQPYYVFDGSGKLVSEGVYFGEQTINLDVVTNGVYCFKLGDKILKYVKIN